MHPSLRILTLILLAVSVQFLEMLPLMITGILLLAIALARQRNLLCKMLHRSRWLLLTLMLIFSFTTPGEYPAWWEWGVAPTYEGARLGLLQVSRLIIMLTGLSLLLGATPRDLLMAGMFPLLRPLRWLGGSPERFTARLWLTVHYVEQEPADVRKMAWNTLERIDQAGRPQPVERIRFMLPTFSARDWCLMIGMACLGAWGLA